VTRAVFHAAALAADNAVSAAAADADADADATATADTQ